jgi:hypothetical protein
MMSAIARSVSNGFKKSTTSLQEVIRAWGSPSGTPLEIDLTADLYSGSTLVANYDKISPPDPNNLFRSLNTYLISL